MQAIKSDQSKPLLGTVIIIDDDHEMRSLLQDFVTTLGYRATDFSNPVDFLKSMEKDNTQVLAPINTGIDLIISDIKMPQMNGLEFTEKMKKLRPEVPIILITAFGSIETAIEAMRLGAFHYVVKPFKLAEMSINIDRAMEHRKLQRENRVLRDEVKKNFISGGLIGKSAAMKEVFDLINRVANATANILITGESGTGKEVVAKAIHDNGPRKDKSFIAINCSAIPETLLESELFGHAKGAFTGAIVKKRGLFEEADGGTLFLDEIGDMNVALQAKLLRVLQERKVRAVGENESREINVRIIAATHKDLKTEIKEGRFREDFYYRLSVIPIVLPPLRHRKEDIPFLAEHFLKKYAALNGADVAGFSKEAITKLMNLRLDGNVRELENMIERAIVLSTHSLITESDIPTPENSPVESFVANTFQELPSISDLEKRYIFFVLEKTGGRKDQTAQILGINRRTLYRKEKEYGVDIGDHPEDSPVTD